MKDIKLYVGPMTQNIIDAVIEYANESENKLGFIASRRQIDHDSGYVGYTTTKFIHYVHSKTKNVLVCRDHSGVNQGAELDSGHASQIYDAIYGFDIIHVDPWKKFQNYDDGLKETIHNIIMINELNKHAYFEVGTEEAIRYFSAEDLFKFLSDLKSNLGKIFDEKVKYAVIQSGTRLLGTSNIGNFNAIRLKEMVAVCKYFKLLSKEHNGDYLSDEEITTRFDAGLNAINIAPEFGVLETKILLEYIKNEKQFNKIYEICLEGKKWKKWVNHGFDPNENKKELIEISGHYHNKQIKKIVKVDDNIIKNKIKEKIKSLLWIAK
jgi:D-tagatose-1,6-bisphosphate aldolase subunit GatZ/KbaZ